jgi:predicted nucleic acid-binding protein
VSYLIDTNVISELRKGSRCDRNVASWFESVSDGELYVSVLTIGELRRGIALVQRRDKASAASLNRWLRTLIENSADRILNVDRVIAEEWGRMNSPAPLPVIDSLIAATAKIHSLTVATRNARDFSRTGVSCINPFVKAARSDSPA